QFDHFLQMVSRVQIHRPHPSLRSLAQVVTAVKPFPHCVHVFASSRLLHPAAIAPAPVVDHIEQDGTLHVRYRIVRPILSGSVADSIPMKMRTSPISFNLLSTSRFASDGRHLISSAISSMPWFLNALSNPSIRAWLCATDGTRKLSS